MPNKDGVYVPSAEDSDGEEKKKEGQKSIRASLFFDGTCNNKTNVRATEKETPTLAINMQKKSYANDISNVVKLEEAWQEDETELIDFPIYIEGAGTKDLGRDKFLGMGFGVSFTGVEAKVKKGISKLMEEIDKLKIKSKKIEYIYLDVFGFSRGAATARYFIYKALNESGKTLKDRLAKKGLTVSDVQVKFVGLFDTVAAHKIDHEDDTVDLHLDAVTEAKYVVQLVAAYEHRAKFGLTNINSALSKGCEIYLPGVHSDIGGGYTNNFEEKDITIFKVEGRRSDEIENALIREKDRLVADGWYKEHELTIVHKKGQKVAGPRTHSRSNDRGFIHANRVIKTNEYSLIPLNIMAGFAQHKGVNKFKILSVKHKIPSGLSAVKEEVYSNILKPGSIGRIGPETWPDSELIKGLKHDYLHYSAQYNISDKPQFTDNDPINGQRKRAVRDG